MILVVDIGNSTIICGLFEEDRIRFTGRLSTRTQKTDLEYALDIKNLLELYKVKFSQVKGCIISSVVPQITDIVRVATEKLFGRETMVLKPGIKTGLNIVMDNPAELGADRVADAVAASNEYPLPLTIIDMGTAMTFSVIDKDKRVVGGAIFPGVRVSLDALTEHASKLSGISLEKPRSVIGRNTEECMRSGVLYGNASLIDGMIDRMEDELGEPLTVIATGGNAEHVIPYCRHKVIHDETLLLRGLKRIYDRNFERR